MCCIRMFVSVAQKRRSGDILGRKPGDPGLGFSKGRLAKLGRLVQRHYSYMAEMNKLRMQYPEEFRIVEVDVIRTMTEKLGYDPRDPAPEVEPVALDSDGRAEKSKAFSQALNEAREKRKAATTVTREE